MDYVLSSHPLSHTFKEDLQENIPGKVSYISLAELKSLSPLAIWQRLRKLKIANLYLAFEDDSSLSVKPTMEMIGVVSGARSIYSIQPASIPQPISKLSTGVLFFRFIYANILARLIFFKSQMRLKSLWKKDRIVVSPLRNPEMLYLKTNLWYGAKAGGSVGHVAGVIGGFVKKGWNLSFSSIEEPIMAEDIVDLIKVPFPTQLAYPPDLNNYVYDSAVVDEIQNVTKIRNFGSIYQRMSINNFSGVELSRKLNIPLVLEYNGSEVWISRNWGRPLVFEKQAQLCEDVCLKHAHVIVTVSDALRDELIERGIDPHKIVTYPNCVDPEQFSPGLITNERALTLRKSLGLDESNTLATFVGTFGKWHGVELLAHTIRRLVDEDREWLDEKGLRFLLIGDGLYMPEVRKIIGEAPYNKYASLSGLVPQKEAPEFLEISDILLSPHIPNDDGSRFFGSPTKLFEYMAMGKGIIASDLEQIGQILENSLRVSQKGLDQIEPSSSGAIGVLVEPGSETELIRGLKFLVGRPDWLRVLGKNARSEALKKYTWSHHVDAIVRKMSQIPSRKIQDRPKNWLYNVFASQTFWTSKLTGFSFCRKVIDRLSLYLLVPSMGHRDLILKSKRKTQFHLRYPEDVGWESLIIFGDYETGTSHVFESVLKDGDVVFDVGANLGWYTTLAAKNIGPTGQVHAFEPVPKIFRKLKANQSLNPEFQDRIYCHNQAISYKELDFELYTYEGLPHGLTSAKALYGQSNRARKISVHSTTLDDHWDSIGNKDVKIVKVDVEGLEYEVVQGAKKLIAEGGPIWLVEINYQTSKAFNWTPVQLLSALSEKNNYKFLRIHEAWGKVYALGDVSELNDGDVVIAYIPEKHASSLEKVIKSIH